MHTVKVKSTEKLQLYINILKCIRLLHFNSIFNDNQKMSSMPILKFNRIAVEHIYIYIYIL